MLEAQVTVINELGLHARAAAQLVKTARQFTSRLMLTRHDSGESANAKSILSLLYIAAAKGVVLTLSADGADETDALQTVLKLFLDGFGEL